MMANFFGNNSWLLLTFSYGITERVSFATIWLTCLFQTWTHCICSQHAVCVYHTPYIFKTRHTSFQHTVHVYNTLYTYTTHLYVFTTHIYVFTTYLYVYNTPVCVYNTLYMFSTRNMCLCSAWKLWRESLDASRWLPRWFSHQLHVEDRNLPSWPFIRISEPDVRSCTDHHDGWGWDCCFARQP